MNFPYNSTVHRVVGNSGIKKAYVDLYIHNVGGRMGGGGRGGGWVVVFVVSIHFHYCAIIPLFVLAPIYLFPVLLFISMLLNL